MPTMRLKKNDGTWDKVPVLGSYQAVLAANEAAKDAEQSALSAQNAATTAEKIATDLGLVDEAVQTAVSSAEQASNSATTASNKADVATAKASEASTSADTATQKADAASASATNAAQSYANADAIAAQLTEYLATKETLTAPAVDKTLLIEGAAADAKVVGELKGDISQIISYRQTEQEYNVNGSLISENWDSQGIGGYYDATGKWIPNDSYRWFRIDGVREDYSLYTKNFGGICFIHVFSGEPSESTFVKRYSSIDSSLPTEGNAVTIPSGYMVIVQNTDSSGITIVCDNKAEYVYGYKIVEIEKKSEQANAKAEQALQATNNTIEKVNMIAPPVERTKVLSITKSMMQFIGNKYPSATGGLYDNDGYWGYTYVIPEDGVFYVKNLGNSSFGFLAIYNDSVADGNLAMDRESGTTFATRNLSKGQIVFISYALTTTEESNVQGGNITHTYEYLERPTMFMREMKVAWFGDSISQLQFLPHRVAEYMGITVNDCSFAGAPLTYGAEAYQGTGFMSLTNQIVNNDFTELESALSNQGTISEDKRGNADRLKGLNFNKITDIVVMAGTNDVNNDYVATSTDLTKFKNGMRTAINTIQNAYPQINLYFISNPYRGDVITDKHGNTLADFVNAEKEVCNEMNIPFYDLYHNSGINANTIDYYLMNDKLHQNENGDILIAQKCAKWLMAN